MRNKHISTRRLPQCPSLSLSLWLMSLCLSAPSLNASLPHCPTSRFPTALLLNCLTASQTHSTTGASLLHRLAVRLPHCRTALLSHHSSSYQMPHCLTALLPHCSLFHNILAPLYMLPLIYFITVFLSQYPLPSAYSNCRFVSPYEISF